MGNGSHETRSTYQRIWSNQPVDTSLAVSGLNHLRLAFFVDAPGKIRGLMYYRDRSDNANHIGVLIKRGVTGNRSAQRAVAFVQNPANVGTFGWNTKYLSAPLALPPGEWWDFVLMFTGGVQWSSAGQLNGVDIVNGHIHVPHDGSTDPFGTVVNNGATQNPATNFNPNASMGGALPALDILFEPDPA